MARYIKLVSVFAFLLIGLIGCTVGRQDPYTELAQESETRIYEVFGMDCPGCHGGLEKILLKNPAILSAEANWEKQRVVIKIKSDAKLSDDEVHEAIIRANFTPGKRIK